MAALHSNECNICVELYDHSSRKPISCPLCLKCACFGCYQQYILNSTQEVHCMHCRKEWSYEFVEEAFPKNFVLKTLRAHREKIWLSKEKSLLPLTQQIYTQKIKEYETLNNCLGELIGQEIRLSNELRQVRLQCSEVKNRIYTLKHGKIKDEKLDIIPMRNCPKNDCRGFLEQNWICGMCDTKVCKSCHVPIGDSKAKNITSLIKDHECKDEDVKSAELIEKETKACPKCKARIFRISGCDQMWCTKCATAFNWVTGQIEKGIIHNPHYFEWARNNNHIDRNPLDVPCGGLPQHIRRDLFEDKQSMISFELILEYAIHVQMVRMNDVPAEKDNQDLRLKYLRNEIDEHKWKSMLTMRKKRYQKLHAFHELDRMFVLVCIDLFQKLNNCKKQEDQDLLLVEFANLRDYYNRISTNISKRFSNCIHTTIEIEGKNWFDAKSKGGKVITTYPRARIYVENLHDDNDRNDNRRYSSSDDGGDTSSWDETDIE